MCELVDLLFNFSLNFFYRQLKSSRHFLFGFRPESVSGQRDSGFGSFVHSPCSINSSLPALDDNHPRPKTTAKFPHLVSLLAEDNTGIASESAMEKKLRDLPAER